MLDYYEIRLRSKVPQFVRSAVFGPLGRWYPALAWAPRFVLGKATFQSLSRPPLEGYFNSISYFRPDEKQRLFTPEFQRSLDGYDTIDVFREHYNRADTDDLLSKIQYLDIKTYLPDDILAKVHRASMAVSLEVRAPLLDHQLMELIARIPSSLKLHGTTGKYIFKKAMADVLPKDILHRRKQGFAVPLARWFRGDLRDLAHEAIFSNDDGILDKTFLKRIWDEHQRNIYYPSSHLWAVLMYRAWRGRVAILAAFMS